MTTVDALSFTFPLMKRMPEAEKKVAVGGRIAPALLAALQSIAAEDERTVSFMVERAVKEFVERRSGKRDKPARR